MPVSCTVHDSRRAFLGRAWRVRRAAGRGAESATGARWKRRGRAAAGTHRAPWLQDGQGVTGLSTSPDWREPRGYHEAILLLWRSRCHVAGPRESLGVAMRDQVFHAAACPRARALHAPPQRERASVGPRARLHRDLPRRRLTASGFPGSTVHVVLRCTCLHIARRAPAATGNSVCGVAPRAIWLRERPPRARPPSSDEPAS